MIFHRYDENKAFCSWYVGPYDSLMLFRILAGLVAAVGSIPAPSPQVTLAVNVSQALPMPPAQLRAMGEETSAIWSGYGVALVWTTDGADLGQARPHLTLTVVDTSTSEIDGPAPSGGPLGGAVFLEGRMSAETRISVSVDAVSALIENGTWLGRDVRALPTSVRNQLVGRALGRVLAHELGHYLLAWRRHSDQGLMRPSFSRQLLMHPSRAPFEVTDFFVPRLRARLTQIGLVGSPPPSAP